MWWQWLFPAGALAVVVALWLLRSRIGRGALVGVLLFVTTVLVTFLLMGEHQVRYAYVADRWGYLPSLELRFADGFVQGHGYTGAWWRSATKKRGNWKS